MWIRYNHFILSFIFSSMNWLCRSFVLQVKIKIVIKCYSLSIIVLRHDMNWIRITIPSISLSTPVYLTNSNIQETWMLNYFCCCSKDVICNPLLDFVILFLNTKFQMNWFYHEYLSEFSCNFHFEYSSSQWPTESWMMVFKKTYIMSYNVKRIPWHQ